MIVVESLWNGMIENCYEMEFKFSRFWTTTVDVITCKANGSGSLDRQPLDRQPLDRQSQDRQSQDRQSQDRQIIMRRNFMI
jgi:hypothetical protein